MPAHTTPTYADCELSLKFAAIQRHFYDSDYLLTVRQAVEESFPNVRILRMWPRNVSLPHRRAKILASSDFDLIFVSEGIEPTQFPHVAYTARHMTSTPYGNIKMLPDAWDDVQDVFSFLSVNGWLEWDNFWLCGFSLGTAIASQIAAVLLYNGAKPDSVNLTVFAGPKPFNEAGATIVSNCNINRWVLNGDFVGFIPTSIPLIRYILSDLDKTIVDQLVNQTADWTLYRQPAGGFYIDKAGNVQHWTQELEYNFWSYGGERFFQECAIWLNPQLREQPFYSGNLVYFHDVGFYANAIATYLNSLTKKNLQGRFMPDESQYWSGGSTGGGGDYGPPVFRGRGGGLIKESQQADALPSGPIFPQGGDYKPGEAPWNWTQAEQAQLMDLLNAQTTQPLSGAAFFQIVGIVTRQSSWYTNSAFAVEQDTPQQQALYNAISNMGGENNWLTQSAFDTIWTILQHFVPLVQGGSSVPGATAGASSLGASFTTPLVQQQQQIQPAPVGGSSLVVISGPQVISSPPSNANPAAIAHIERIPVARQRHQRVTVPRAGSNSPQP